LGDCRMAEDKFGKPLFLLCGSKNLEKERGGQRRGKGTRAGARVCSNKRWLRTGMEGDKHLKEKGRQKKGE